MIRVSKNSRAGFAIAASCVAGLAQTAHCAPVLVDIGPDNGRNDALTKKALNWKINDASTLSFGMGNGVTATLSAVESEVKPVLWKGGLDTGATLTTDGVQVEKGKLWLQLSGLAAGHHSLATFHSSLNNKAVTGLRVTALGSGKTQDVTPSQRVKYDDEAASAFFEFDTKQGEDVIFEIAALNPETPLILNGFELDGVNPQLKARRLTPAADDEHVDETFPLSWVAGGNAVKHRVYFGEDQQGVAQASTKSPEYKGEQTATNYALPAKLDHMKAYFWRVDEVQQDGTVTLGQVASFRVRHLAFPTAEGYGRFAIGGRGGRVIEVSNLEDYDKGETSIPGSYRAALEAEGPRTVIFRVSGIIRLKRPCTVFNPYITVAGQTAPGDGICIANYPSGAYSSHDAIFRFMRFRIGDFAKKGVDGAGLGNCNNSIIDHSSISWASDEGTSSRGAKNITFQRNIVAESLHHSYHYNAKDRTKFETHAFAGSISGNVGSYHHNLLAHCTDRNWSLAGGYDQSVNYAGYLDIRNNVVYNWTARTTDGGVMKLNYVNNYYKPYAPNKPVNWLLKLDPIDLDHGTPQYYMSGNVMEGFDYENDNWKAFNPTNNPPSIQDVIRSDKELYPSYVTTQSAGDAYKSVLADVGATFPKQDAIDRRIIEETRTGTVHYIGNKGQTWTPPSKNIPGIIDTQDDVKDAIGSPDAPWPEYKTYNVPVDTDHDGMPDDWELKRKLNPKDAADGNADGDKDGYTNLEEYLGWLVGEFPDVK